MTRTDSRFNAYLNGDTGALSEQELRGLEGFKAAGCTACHNGINLGGNSYQSIGGDYLPADAGLYARSGREADRGAFKVPTLHNVALTAPYFHDGSLATLEEAVQVMLTQTSAVAVDDQGIADIVAFLHSLSSEFFATMAPRMDNESIRGEMHQQMQQMNQGMHADHGAMNHTMSHAMHHQHEMPGQAHTGHGTEGSVAAPAAHEAVKSVPPPTDHASAYAKALDHALQAESRISAEMERIQQGEVAHFDFLQFEYGEALRHARALAFPPESIAGDQRQAVTEQAAGLLQAVESLEWIIADFLRAEAGGADTRPLVSRIENLDLTQSALAVQAAYTKAP
ncbi:MAG: hypothetical protein RLZZ385_2205 [Pseudomonadota bacterium]|jgi:hypothetical protein